MVESGVREGRVHLDLFSENYVRSKFLAICEEAFEQNCAIVASILGRKKLSGLES